MPFSFASSRISFLGITLRPRTSWHTWRRWTLVGCTFRGDTRRCSLYCVQELHLSEDAAYKRIQAARAARRFTLLFSAVAEGKVHLAAVCMLAPHLTAENVEDLVEAATHRKKSEIEVLLARRFPVSGARSGMTATIRAIPQLAPGQPQRSDPAGLALPT